MRRWWPELAAIAIAVALWEVVGRRYEFPFWPAFSLVIQAWWQIYQTGELMTELLQSISSLAIGYSLAVVLGLFLGGLMGRYRKVAYFFELLIDINLATPTLVYMPFLFALFGISFATRYIIVFMYAFFIIVINTMTGIRTADTTLIEMARAFGATESQLFGKILLPSALPLIMAGLRIGMSRAVKGMINGELFIALVGLGARLRNYSGAFQIEKTLAILLTIIVVALIATGMVQFFERSLTNWAETIQK